jgi:hypothetical protein
LTGALAGLGSFERAGPIGFNMADADATPQFISSDCTPYASAFAQYTITSNFPALAAHYGVSEDELLATDPALSGKRATAADIEDGDIIDIPLMSGASDIQLISMTPTFDEIAAAHGVTELAIFNDPANAGLRAKRGAPAHVNIGDTIMVTPACGATDWVIGHDL